MAEQMMSVREFLQDESGQGMVEYGLIIALVSVVLIGALAGFQNAREDVFTAIVTAMTEVV